MKRIISVFMVIVIACSLMSTSAFAATDFSGRQSSTYSLSNGKKVRIEYHGGQPHFHELDSNNRDLGSENLNDSSAHHSDGKKPSKDTSDIGKTEGVRGDIAFAQSCLETGNFTFSDSAVTLDQNNF